MVITMQRVKTKVQIRTDAKLNNGSATNLFRIRETPFKTIGAWIK